MCHFPRVPPRWTVSGFEFQDRGSPFPATTVGQLVFGTSAPISDGELI
jgi:hypothetical protein